MVDFIRQIDLNVFSMMMMMTILFALNEQKFNRSKSKSAFKRLLIGILVMLVLDIVTWYVDGKSGDIYRMMNFVTNSILLGLTPLPPILWLLYLSTLIQKDFIPGKRYYVYLFAPLGIIMLMSVCSPFTGWIFTVSPDNIYSRQPLFNLMNLFSFSYAAYGSVIILRNRKKYKKTKLFSLLSFMFLPLIGGIFQILFYGLILYWNSLALSMIIMYLNVQSKEVNLDYLTDVNSRKSLDNHLNKRILSFNPNNKFAVIMIDIDKFKEINDKYGHKAGDRALVNFAESLKNSIRNNDFIARYGGDEFVIVMDCDSRTAVDRSILRIKKTLEQFNRESREPYKLDFSYGYSIYDEKQMLDADHFVDYVDQLMYDYKKNKQTMT
jgi:diguanylate cyclase (GGDEF)-like protein